MQFHIIIKSWVEVAANTSIQVEDQILLKLMELRLNRDFKDLNFRFIISKTSVLVYSINIIGIIFRRFENLIFCQKDHQSLEIMTAFEKCINKKVTVNIDSSKIKTEIF